jgi:hypothetical protein
MKCSAQSVLWGDTSAAAERSLMSALQNRHCTPSAYCISFRKGCQGDTAYSRAMELELHDPLYSSVVTRYKKKTIERRKLSSTHDTHNCNHELP